MIRKIILSVLMLLVLAGAFMAWRVFKPAVKNEREQYLYIQTGDDLASVKEKLINGQFISGKQFDLVARLLSFRTVKPGRYQPKNGMSLVKLVRMLRNGEQAPVKMVIVKERTKQLFAGKFGKKFDLETDSLAMIRFMSSNDSLEPYGVDTLTVMCLVMPYTYSLKWNSPARRIFEEYHLAWKNFWSEERKAKADRIGLSPVQVSILASIVEEETNRKADRYNIASTYINRLKKDMKLQADPTVKFVTRNFNLGRITGSHLALESPYNTYIHKGLPPGPICTPSVESLEAVLDAPDTDYLFFVASHAFDGSTIFTTNFDDHRKYVRLFHAEQQRRADSLKKLKADP